METTIKGFKGILTDFEGDPASLIAGQEFQHGALTLRVLGVPDGITIWVEVLKDARV